MSGNYLLRLWIPTQNGETPKAVFKKWWLGTDGTYFGLFLESPWPFVMAWTCFGFSSFIIVDDTVAPGKSINFIHHRENIKNFTLCLPDALAIVMLIICILQGVDAGILIQQNLYAGNMAGKNKFSLPFVVVSNSICVLMIDSILIISIGSKDSISNCGQSNIHLYSQLWLKVLHFCPWKIEPISIFSLFSTVRWNWVKYEPSTGDT